MLARVSTQCMVERKVLVWLRADLLAPRARARKLHRKIHHQASTAPPSHLSSNPATHHPHHGTALLNPSPNISALANLPHLPHPKCAPSRTAQQFKNLLVDLPNFRQKRQKEIHRSPNNSNPIPPATPRYPTTIEVQSDARAAALDDPSRVAAFQEEEARGGGVGTAEDVSEYA